MDKNIKLTIVLLILLSLISLLTHYSGSTDYGDYAYVAKFFAGKYNANIRTSHNLLYGFIYSPLVWIFNGVFVMKIASLLFLILIVFSLYYISKKNKITLLLLIASPIVWFMGPWISPIQLATLLFLWGFFFIEKFDKSGKKQYLLYSGLLIGLSWAFWNTMLFILFFFIICFFYNKKFKHLILFLFSIILGLSPLLIFDQIVYGMAFFSILKHIGGIFTFSFYGSIYQLGSTETHSIIRYITFLLMFPIFSYRLFSKSFFKENKKEIIFLTLVFLFFLFNPQVRYILVFWPVLILYLSKALTKKQFRIQFIIFLIISLVVINPYIIQVKYYFVNPSDEYMDPHADIVFITNNIQNLKITSISQEELIREDLKQIAKEYPNESFVVGNTPDNYAYLAFVYLGEEIKEFVSIQDYDLYLNNESALFEKKLVFNSKLPSVPDRRQIWIGGGIGKSENDNTDYENIEFGIGRGEQINLKDFKLLKKYNILYLSEKI